MTKTYIFRLTLDLSGGDLLSRLKKSQKAILDLPEFDFLHRYSIPEEQYQRVPVLTFCASLDHIWDISERISGAASLLKDCTLDFPEIPVGVRGLRLERYM